MRSVFCFLALPFMIIASPMAEAETYETDERSIEVFTDLVHSYIDNDSAKFWEICSQFEKPQFHNQQDVENWMKDRMATKETFFKVKGVVVYGQATITDEKLGEVTFRFDGTNKSPSRIIVVTAFIDRIIEFDDSVPVNQRRVGQEAILKIYVTLVNNKLLSYKSDEINFGYEFVMPKARASK